MVKDDTEHHETMYEVVKEKMTHGLIRFKMRKKRNKRKKNI